MYNAAIMESLEKIVVEPSLPAKASVIWLHGLGADGNDFVNIVPELHLPEELAVRFVFPHAPVRPVSLNFGYKMRAWFDIYALAENAKQDREGIEESQRLIAQLIAAEIESGVETDKIVLAGFSQGGAMALYCGLRYPAQLAGVLVLSGFLPLAFDLAAEKSAINQNAPILMLHGENDGVVPLKWALDGKKKLEDDGYKVKWREYQVAHGVCMEEILTVAEWLREVFYK